MADPATAADYEKALALSEEIAALTRAQEEQTALWAEAAEELEGLEATR